MPSQESSGCLTLSQHRALDQVLDLCARAAPHLTALRIAGVPAEQDEERIQHLIQACEGMKKLDEQLRGNAG